MALANVDYNVIVKDTNSIKFYVEARKIATWRAVMKCRYFENNDQLHYNTIWQDRVRTATHHTEVVHREGADNVGLHVSLLKVFLNGQNQKFVIHIYHGNLQHPTERTILIQGSYREQWEQDEFFVLNQIVDDTYRNGISLQEIWQDALINTDPMPPPLVGAAGAQQNQNPPSPQPEVPGEAAPPPAEEAVVDAMANLNLNNGADQAGDIPGNA